MEVKTKIRIGMGYDIHRLVKNRKLFLGGIEIPFTKGLSGHSDADVLLHAVCDALLGAVSGGDLGEHFPDTDPRYKGISSLQLLKSVYNMVQRKGFKIANLDVTLLVEKPRLESFKPAIRRCVAQHLGLEQNQVSIKAGSNEGLDAVGRGMAISAYAVVLLSK